MNQIENSLWTEKYRPSMLSEYIGNDELKLKVQKYIDDGDVPHLLFYGKPGTGKCLDFSEEIDIEMELSDQERLILSKYMI